MSQNADLLEQAWTTYWAMASADDARVAGQSIDYADYPITPYDHAANLVTALIRVVYPMSDPAVIFRLFSEAGECLAPAEVERGLIDNYAR
ncbi:hypothetical protein FDH96_gp113 [Mycobacterium phage Rey]|uniref:Uncharacterized protein n=1 Tax=Mycobacterium phage Rey TaxID=1034115 RepID=G1D5K6_9CAUD|nr:hypothetical protein FDH96_gp113 [Mycobacterium phage Rey]AEK10054.1 hypothetical protein PBI_REY_166 [Mycobacterium phage Rey]